MHGYSGIKAKYLQKTSEYETNPSYSTTFYRTQNLEVLNGTMSKETEKLAQTLGFSPEKANTLNSMASNS
jgi:hypothetical protein